MYQEIISAAYKDHEETPKSCLTMMDFVRFIKQSPLSTSTETFFIILDKAERLRNMDAHLLPSFLRLQELTGLNLCVVLLSELCFEKFYTSTGVQNPVRLNFPNYSKGDLATIMVRDCPEGMSEKSYQQYVKIVADVFCGVCRDLNELRHLVSGLH